MRNCRNYHTFFASLPPSGFVDDAFNGFLNIALSNGRRDGICVSSRAARATSRFESASRLKSFCPRPNLSIYTSLS